MIGKTFTDVWDNRQRILTMKKLSHALERYGLTASDIPKLVSRFDVDGTGELDLEEFQRLLFAVHVKVQHEHAVVIFEAIGNGECVSAKKIVRTLFPEAYHDVCSSKA